MSKPPRRADITDPAMRAAIEKIRGNTNVAMLQALGGTFVYDADAREGARGYAILMEAIDASGNFWRLTVVPKP